MDMATKAKSKPQPGAAPARAIPICTTICARSTRRGC